MTTTALLLDMDGVIHIGSRAVPGAGEALSALRASGISLRFVTNTTTRTRKGLSAKMKALGLDISQNEIFTVVDACVDYLSALGRPTIFPLIDGAITDPFSTFPRDQQTPDYVVIGDIGSRWTYEILNTAFNCLRRGAKLLCMHRNKYWQSENGLCMDIGAFVAALEYVSGQSAIVIGKPNPAFFEAALRSLAVEPERCAMVGDDLEADIGGAQGCGLYSILVKTGKYRQELVENSNIRADLVIDSIAALPKCLNIGTR